jgi:putative membrane protein
MIYSGGMGLGGIWLIILLVIVIALLVLIAVRLFTGPAQHWDRRTPPPAVPPMPGHPPGMPLDTPPAAQNRARDILDERLARGEITPEQYRELRRAIEEQ